MNLDIIVATPEHAAAISELAIQGTRSWANDIDYEHLSATRYSPEAVGATIQDEATVVLVALLDGVPVGTISVTAEPDGRFYVYGLAVSPTVRKQGVGKAVMLEAIKIFGATEAYAEIEHMNTGALHLFGATGFEVVQRNPAQISDTFYVIHRYVKGH